jgi:hypothetical protein
LSDRQPVQHRRHHKARQPPFFQVQFFAYIGLYGLNI